MRLGDWETAGTLAEKAQKHTVDANLLSAITSLPPAIERGKAMALYREASAKFSVVMSKVNGERYDPYEFEFIHIQDLLNNASSHSVGEDLTDAIKRLSKNVSDIMSELDNMGRLHTGSGLGRFGL